MSEDYTRVVEKSGTVTQSVIVNGTLVLGYLFSKSFNFKVLHCQARINTAATAESQTFQVQKSAANGTFSSPTTIATLTIASSTAVAAMLEARVSETSQAGTIEANGTRCARIVHVGAATDATLNYDWVVSHTARHE